VLTNIEHRDKQKNAYEKDARPSEEFFSAMRCRCDYHADACISVVALYADDTARALGRGVNIQGLSSNNALVNDGLWQ
jgi:hypothetical protein